MQLPAKRSSQRGFLLVEAILSAIVIAVGVAAIGRGLSSQLTTLRSLQNYDVAADGAQSKLTTLEGKLVSRQLIPQDEQELSSITDGPSDEDHPLRTTRITMMSDAGTLSPRSIRLSVLWPEAWLPQEWRSKP